MKGFFVLMVLFGQGLAFEALDWSKLAAPRARPLSSPVCAVDDLNWSSWPLSIASAARPPPSINWVEKGAVTDVENQAGCASCWAFAAAGAVEGAYFLATKNLVKLSAQQLLDCAPKSGGCENEGYVDYAFDYTRRNGLVTEEKYPYLGEKGDCQEIGSVPKVMIHGCRFVLSNNPAALKIAVARQPVAAKLDSTCPGFEDYERGVFTCDCPEPKPNHDVLIVGYGATTNGEAYWLIKNSWGEIWGEKGYMRLRRGSGGEVGECGIAMEASYPIINHPKISSF